jgi:hypothetical protein
MRPIARLQGFRRVRCDQMPLEYLLSLVVPVEGRWVKDNGLACGRIGSGVPALTYC